jgi:tetratricopeptide (TPR) repeat protein
MQALDHALRAVQLDPREARCHLFLGQVYSHIGKTDLAISHMEQSVRLNPNDDTSLAGWGALLIRVGRTQEGVDLIQRAMQLNPFHPRWYWGMLALGLFFCGRYKEALGANAKLDREKKLHHFIRDAAILAELGREYEARAVVDEILRQQPDFRAGTFAARFRLPANAELMCSALIKAGLPE